MGSERQVWGTKVKNEHDDESGALQCEEHLEFLPRPNLITVKQVTGEDKQVT